MLTRAESYEALTRAFRWTIPARINIGVDACDRHAEARPDATALVFEDESGTTRRYSFAALRDLSNRLANALAGLGLARGDRVGIYLPQSPETALAHLAVYKAGFVAVPLFAALFRAPRHRVFSPTSGAGGHRQRQAEVIVARTARLDPATVIEVGGLARRISRPSSIAPRCASRHDTADDPAASSTPRTTGVPKGALHGHRILLGQRQGRIPAYDFFLQRRAIVGRSGLGVIGGLFDVLLMPAWFHGVPVVAHRFQ